MPRIIFKCPYIKPGTEGAAAHRGRYVRYAATRDGVEKLTPDKANRPATKKQREMVEQLLRDFPESHGMFEYEDYCAEPTQGKASEFITRALEDNYDQITKRENYVGYIANRPRAERFGDHGLFNSTDDALELSTVAVAVANHPGNVWLPIISLRREDAARLGYDSAKQWRALLTTYATEISEALKIPWEQFRWYAAFHNEGSHPHIHMVCYSADGRSGFLDEGGIARIKSGLANNIFRQELTELYQQQTQRRDELVRESSGVMKELVQQMQSGTLENPRIEQLMNELAQQLKTTSGKKQYGYLKAPLKNLVDEIVDELAKDSRVVAAYELWYRLWEEVLQTYRDDLPERVPLSRQKEFKRIRNLVIEEAVRLGEYTKVFAPEDAVEQEPVLMLEDDPQDTDVPEPADEAPPVVEWSARYKRARMLLFGDGDTPQDHEAAYRLFLKEAYSGNALAMYDVGKLFADGIGVDADAEQSRMWYAKALAAFQAVERQYPSRYVEYRIGKMYAVGLGTEQDDTAAARWFSPAADRRYKYAQYTLAGLYSRGRGVPRDDEKALELYTSAAEQGVPYAAWELGKRYRDGVGCSPDVRQAGRFFSMAYQGFRTLVEQRPDDRLQYRIGWMLLHGVGTERNESTAVEWLEKSAKLKNHYAQYTLGKLYRDGGPVARDLTKAVIWFSQAAEAGNQDAMYALGKLHLEVNDPAVALRWFHQSAEQGNQYAQYALGKLYLLGKDVPQDRETAARWFTLAVEQGNQYAQFFLDHMDDTPSLFASAVRLIHHMGRVFQEQSPPPMGGVSFVDSKLRRKIKEKKIAMGHKPDDHEEQGQRLQ